jgi:hypothetical protein
MNDDAHFAHTRRRRAAQIVKPETQKLQLVLAESRNL